MRRIAMAALLLASAGALGGCVFAVGHGDDDEGKRIKDLESRISRAEHALGLPEGGGK